MIEEYRKKRGYTQEELAELLEISPRQLQRIENKQSETKLSTLRKIIKILKIENEDIIKIIIENK